MPPARKPTLPAQTNTEQEAAFVMIEPYYADPLTGAQYIHQDLVKVRGDWETEAHISPPKVAQSFGDVESWVEYVKNYGPVAINPFLTWSEAGLTAILDYHGNLGEHGRCQWIAKCPFVKSVAWERWLHLADGRPRGQRELLEAFEDLAADIVVPDAGRLAETLRSLRTTVNLSASTDLYADGSSKVSFTKNKTIQSGELTLPAEISIAIPVLKGHVDSTSDGRKVPVIYRLEIRLRPQISDEGPLLVRLSAPGAERVLEAVLDDQVEHAAKLLGDGYRLYRGRSGPGGIE